MMHICCSTLTVQDNRSSGYDYALVDDGLPEFKSENDENLPVRWKAPESLSGNQYSIASDVWAFAVLVYEVLTLGCRPYRDIQKDDQVVEYVRIALIISSLAFIIQMFILLVTSSTIYHLFIHPLRSLLHQL